MSFERRAADEVFRHHAFGVRDLDLAFDDAADRVALEAFGDARAEGFVEVRADDALGVGARERVAGAALGDERLLAEDQVGVVVALDGEQPAAAERERDEQRRARDARSGAPRRPPSAAARPRGWRA